MIAIWIILVVVLAAAAGVIAIAVQNDKRQKQLSTLENAAQRYQQINPAPATPASSARPAGRPSQRQRMNTQQQHGGPRRYNAAMVGAEAQLANRLPPGFADSSYNNNVGMTSFGVPQAAPAHMMSTTPMPRAQSGSGALFVPSQSPQADMPAQQLFVSHNFPSTVENTLQAHSVSPSGIDHSNNTSVNNFVGSAYFQDPAQMTPNTYADGLGLEAYMPNVSNATPDGLDPQTGLPVFSTASLRRSNELSSRGLQGFLRPTMDDTQGYKHTVGKILQPGRYNECQVNNRRNQFNAARINSAEDPVLFGITDYMYLP